MAGEWKRCHYRCPKCGKEWDRSFPKDERKTKAWCPVCKHFVTPAHTTKPQTTQYTVRVKKPKSWW